MAVRFDAATDRISYTGGAPNPTAGLTVTAWAYVSVDQNDYATICRLYNGGTAATFATSGDGLGGPNYFTVGGTLTSATGFVVGQWRKVAISCTGTSGAVYVAAPAGVTEVDTGTVAGVAAPNAVTLAGRATADSSEWWNGRLAHVRVWTVALSQAEIEAEWASATPVRTSGLWAAWPLAVHTDLTDVSGNGRHLTAGSTATTTEADPPIAVDTTGTATGTGGGAGAAAGVRERTATAAGTGGGQGLAAGAPESATVTGAATGHGGGVGAATGSEQLSVVGVASGAGGGVGVGTGVREVTAVGLGVGGGVGAAVGVGEVTGVAVGVGGGLGAVVVFAESVTPIERVFSVPAESRVLTVPAEIRVLEVT
ncbi:MAG: LamG-like jellyroll fold domain-containing protein [Actinophytocola sp.]|uniref:LamG-like jellyroll fold domain-containing protein n=1 Tax=Actinophytocola sp. TaxID=1872138 RepID=UPI003C72CD55